MDAFESFLADFVIKLIHKSAPNLSADDDLKIRRTVQDFVTAAMDLSAVYFAIRRAKKNSK